MKTKFIPILLIGLVNVNADDLKVPTTSSIIVEQSRIKKFTKDEAALNKASEQIQEIVLTDNSKSNENKITEEEKIINMYIKLKNELSNYKNEKIEKDWMIQDINSAIELLNNIINNKAEIKK